MEALAAAPPKQEPYESRWRLRGGDEIGPGLSALKLLGGGLRYEAYMAWNDHLHSLVVVKVVRPGLVEDPHTLAGLAEEADMLERLGHPVLVRGFGAVLDGPRPHVILEHLEGPRLSTLIRKYGPLPAEQLLPLGLQLSAAAHYMAMEGVVHLDIKPSNIIMGAPAKLIDLSVARTIEGGRGLRAGVGTDSYMAPEQCGTGHGGPLGPAADVWGIGVTLYRAASGERPFEKGDPDSNDPEARWPQLTTAPKPISDKVPPPIAEAIMSCLEYDPRKRPAAAELAATLEPIFAALPRPWVSKLKPRRGKA
jgi:eukaryotic-like serine/threonine-protein kinase